MILQNKSSSFKKENRTPMALGNAVKEKYCGYIVADTKGNVKCTNYTNL